MVKILKYEKLEVDGNNTLTV